MRIPLHAGHLGELAGHDHWVAGIGAGVVVAGALAAWWGGRKAEEEPLEEAEPEPEERPA